ACLTTLKNVQKKYVCPPGKKEPCSPNPQSTIVGMSGGLQLNIDVSCAMKSPPFQNYPFRSGVLSGGEVPLPGGGGPAATGFITFSASINDQFTYPHPPGDPFIDKHDPLLNAAAIRGNLASNANVKNPPAIGPSCGDDSYTCLSVPGDTLTKIVYAKNGVVLNPLPAPTGTPLPRFTRGDTITYRLSKTIPTGDAEDVRITDWFPLPMLPVPTLLPAIGACTGLPPTAAAIACSVAPVAPQMTYVAPNALEFNFGTFNNTANTPQTFEVYVTLTVSNDPRPDGLFLTNHARECEKNTFGVKFCQTAIAQFELTEPLMRIRKGVICPTPNCPEINPSSDIALPDTARIGIDDPIVIAGPIKTTWKCAPPLTCPMFAGIITGIATPLLNTSSVNVDANDEVTFAIVAENGGNGPYGAYGVTIGDTLSGLPATFVAGSLCVRRGDGATIPYTSGSPFPITLTTPLPPPSAGAAKNVVVITFRVKMPGNNKAEIGKCLDNTASIKFYTNMPGGQNFVTSGLVAPGSSVASACVKPKELTKSIVATSETHTPSLQVTIGEIVRYRLHLQIPEGYTNTLSLSDLLPTGLKYLGPPSYTWIPAAMGVPQSPVWNPQQLTLSFSPVSNNSQNTAACEFLNAEFPALVQNISTNINGVTLANGFSASATAGALGTFVATPATTVTVVEPHITIAKSAAPASVGPGGLVSYTVTLTSDGTSDAFDIKLNDLVPPSLINVMPNPAVMNPPGCATFTAPAAGNTVTSTSIKMPKKPAIGPMCSATFTIHGQLAPGICPPKVTNIATVTWTSLPGPKGTGNVTPGASGAVDGERIYNASASADFACVNASHCDFWIKKSGTKQQTPIGTLVTYTITVGVTPPGIDCPCSPIQIIDALPTQLGNITVGPDPQYWSHTLVGNTLTLSTTKQPPPMPATFTVSGYMTAVPPPPTLQNCARILCNDPNPADNSSCATLTFP
ncbi:MAG TPA: hypothetical protein VN181_14840, partial [Thermoanaerobaculia bacterium]|nr:hypothetical protein [Thermoanaerobaculia bacterium]